MAAGAQIDHRLELTSARGPWTLSWRRWRRVLARTYSDIRRDSITIVAAGCAFFGLLAVAPAVTAMVTIYGLVADPTDVARHFARFETLAPGPGLELLREQAERIAATPSGALGLSALVSLAIALWSAAKATRATFGALNIAYEEEEKRGFIGLNLRILALTAAAILAFLVVLAAIVATTTWLRATGIGGPFGVFVSAVRWVLLGVLAVGALMALYQLAPSRAAAAWTWLAPGAVAAAFMWLIGSVAFSLYAASFADFGAAYGSLGAVVVLLLWFYLSALAVLLGAELNSELEREMTADTTTGEPLPIGMRGAAVADAAAGAARRDSS